MQSEKEILVIDDNEDFLKLIKIFLEHEGFTVLTCPIPASALALAREWAFDIYIVDYRFPGISGDAVTAAIRKLHPSTVIIGCSIELREQEFLAAGADAFISKEQIAIELPVVVRRYCAHHGR